MFKPQTARTGRHATETDPRRALGLKQSCDLLVAGGYFRAKMPTLSPFDRVVGGLVWCITASYVDVDVDILYEENSSIGERLRVSEQIVRSLQLMKCPFQLQSFQIQGLDYDSLLPTLKWLIKQVIQTRALTGNESRMISTRSFDYRIGSSNFLSPDQREIVPIFPEDQFIHTSVQSTGDYITMYHQQRKYKKRPGLSFDSLDEKVAATLLEYDDRHVRVAVDLEQADIERKKKEQQGRGGGSGSGRGDADKHAQFGSPDEPFGSVDPSSIEGAELQRLQESNRLRQLQGQLDSSGAAESQGLFKVNAGLLGSLVMISDDVLKAKEEYLAQDKIQQEKVSLKDQREVEEQRHQKHCEQLRRKIDAITNEVNTRQTEFGLVDATYKTVLETYEERMKQVQEMKVKLQELDVIESKTENKEVLAELKRFVILNEQLKKQEIAFKASCKEQMAAYRTDIDSLKQKLGQLDDQSAADEETRKFHDLQQLIAKETSRLDKVKELLYQRHLELLSVYHKIDEVPTRSELLQFEKRFIELYQITATKLIETRSYFTWYNTLSTTYGHLQQELTLLESILSNFTIGMKTEKSRAEMQNQMKLILASMNENVNSTEQELNTEVEQETMLAQKYNKLMSKERDYYKLLKQFQLECDLNTKLGQQAEELQLG